MKRSIIILYWLIICVPTLVVGSFAWSMLQHEQERLQMARRVSAEGRAELLTQHLQVAVYDIQTSLRSALERAVDAKQGTARQAELRHLAESNPLVRNVFEWSPADGVHYPNPVKPATPEERRFLLRYAALFNGTVPWEPASGSEQPDPGRGVTNSDSLLQTEVANGMDAPPDADDQSLELDVGQSSEPAADAIDKRQPTPKPTFPNQMLQQSSYVQSQPEPPAQGNYGAVDTRSAGSGRGGWVPWYADNRLGLLGWYQGEPDGEIVGVEIEMMAFLSRLLPSLPTASPDGELTLLLDGDGHPLYQSAPLASFFQPTAKARPGSTQLELNAGVEEMARRPVGDSLPHWQVVVYGGPNSYPGGGFEAVSRLLLAIFVAAVLIGGSLLLWQARRYQTEARQKTSFVSNVSHELKTPLTSIRMYAELLSEGRARDPAKAQRYLEIIVTESQRLTRLVGNVLDFSRLEQGSQRFQPVDLDLAEVVNLTLDGIAMRLEAAGMALTVELPTDGPAIVHADRDALEQILLNLLENALKYGHAGGELHLSLSRDGQGRVLLSLADRGPGVPTGQRERIFDAFHRVDDALTATTGGTGLGLSIARRLAHGMGGDLSYRPNTAAGRSAGARFDLHLPAAGAGTASPPSPALS